MKLFEPGRIGKLNLKNRIVMSAMGTRMGTFSEPEGNLSPQAKDYHVARAKGGAGLIITGSARVSREIEFLQPAPPGSPPLSHPVFLRADQGSYARGFAELAEAIHQCGAKLAVQLQAGEGRNITLPFIRKIGAVAPSAAPCYWDPHVTARALTRVEIKRLVDAFGVAAELLQGAGIDAIEINAHSGYLVDQFLTALWNRRTDEYGGNLDGRLRFLLEIVAQVKKGAGADFPVIVKFALTHHCRGGREIAAGVDIARRLEAAGVDALSIDAGCYETWHWVKPTTYSPPGALVELAERVKRAVHIPVIAVGKLGYPDLAEKVLQAGRADFIGLGRPLLADPEWPNKVKCGRTDDICPCLGDHEGCSGRIAEGKTVSCVVNPACGREGEFSLKRAETKKRVLVVGGGPGGMEAARVAAVQGHEVILYEKGESLGGNLIPAAAPDFKQDYRLLIDYLTVQIQTLGVAINLRKEATPELIREAAPDAVIVATGSTAFIPEVKGIESEAVMTAVDLLSGTKHAGEQVVIFGGGIVGCETALYLAQKGKKVTVVARHGLARSLFPANRLHLLKLLSDADVKTFPDTRVLEIINNGAVISDAHGRQSLLACDSVVLALGMRPDRRLGDILQAEMPEVHVIGDCAEPRKVMDAIWEGFHTARLI